MIDWLKCKLQGRSPKWRKVRQDILEKYICCRSCNALKNLELHHKIPFNLRPDLELDPENLIVLCKHCHFTIGHFNDYKCYNSAVDDDCDLFLMRTITNKKRHT